MQINPGFLSVLFLSLIHLLGNNKRWSELIWKGPFLSFAAGISFSYVFIKLLPELEKGQPLLKQTFNPIIPYLDRHTYLIALFGVLFYYGIHTSTLSGTKSGYWINLMGYQLFNFFVGASLADINDPDIQPLLLLTIAIGMHYFIRDHQAYVKDALLYDRYARWLLILALFAGYGVGYFMNIPDILVAIVVSFIAGGILLNALRYDLPKREQIGYGFFVLGALMFTIILLHIGRSNT